MPASQSNGRAAIALGYTDRDTARVTTIFGYHTQKIAQAG